MSRKVATTGNGFSLHTRAFHAAEAVRIGAELDALGPNFADDGIVRTVLRERIQEETRRAEHGCNKCEGL